jgi:NADPH-dependent 7-cyano-7-deazaguanine reductase QueF-like protein
MENKFSKNVIKEQSEVNKLSTVFEAVVADQIYFSEWLGEGADAIVSSKYDDIKNGVDVIVERDSEDEMHHLALAIDVTFGQDVGYKFDKIKREIDNGKLTEVKYFSHGSDDFGVGLKNIPRVVIGADINTVKELSEFWVGGDKKALGSHRIQVQILEEIAIQLKTFKRYAESINETEVAEKYDETFKIIDRVISEKINIPSEGMEDDKVYRAINNEMEIFASKF